MRRRLAGAPVRRHCWWGERWGAEAEVRGTRQAADAASPVTLHAPADRRLRRRIPGGEAARGAAEQAPGGAHHRCTARLRASAQVPAAPRRRLVPCLVPFMLCRRKLRTSRTFLDASETERRQSCAVGCPARRCYYHAAQVPRPRAPQSPEFIMGCRGAGTRCRSTSSCTSQVCSTDPHSGCCATCTCLTSPPPSCR